VDVAAADEIYQDNSPVIQLEVNGDVRAYGLDILVWHEIVNDVVGGVPVAVTFCPLCNSAIAFDRRLGAEAFEFGTPGLLRKSDLVMYDRTTESLWQQIGGRAIVGLMVGARLEPLPAPVVSWGQFKKSFPDGLVLSRLTGFVFPYGENPYTGYDSFEQPTDTSLDGTSSGGDDRLSVFDRVVTIEAGADVVAYPFSALREKRVIEDERDGRPLVVFWTPGASSALDQALVDDGRGVGSTGVFERRLNGELMVFQPNPDDAQTFIDQGTESTWNVFGRAVAGPLTGAQMEPFVHGNHLWFAWAAFQPDTIVVRG